MTAQSALLDIDHMTIAFGGLEAVNDVSMRIYPG